MSHLARRFLDTVLSRPLEASEAAFVEARLAEPLARLFFEQPAMDQRHGYEAALFVVASGADVGSVVAAALLHDIGKRHARLGVLGRTMATLMIKARLPLPLRMGAYRDHGAEASLELARLGADTVVVDFALSHHGRRPDSIEPVTWAVLQAADGNQSHSGGQE